MPLAVDGHKPNMVVASFPACLSAPGRQAGKLATTDKTYVVLGIARSVGRSRVVLDNRHEIFPGDECCSIRDTCLYVFSRQSRVSCKEIMEIEVMREVL